MVWSSISPDGSKSVKQNAPVMAANTVYTETTMNVDHFWNKGSTLNGHHQFVQTQATNDADKTLPTNPTIATDMDLAYYSRFKTPFESTASQSPEPFALSSATSVMQILGMRACVVFNASTVTPLQANVVYAHNMQAQPNGVVRVPQTGGTGDYAIQFQNALPSSNYMVFASGITAAGNGCIGVVKSGTLTQYKTTASVRVQFYSINAPTVLVDPVQAWVICFGG